MEKRTITAIVVDDELNARRLLPVLIDWDALGYRFAGEASSGNEALDLVESLRPDVVFTDINMPYMDGLELARQIRERDPFAKIVIMTAYAEFEYAKTSIRLGVQDFLLKPLQPEVVSKLAESLKQTIEQETAHWNEYRLMQDQLKLNAEHVKEKFLNDLLIGTADTGDLIRRHAYFLGRTFGDFCSVAVVEARAEGAATEEHRLLLGMGCKRIVESLAQGMEGVDVFQDNAGRVVMMNWNPETDLEKLGELSIRAISGKLGGQASVGIGGSCRDLRNIKDSYREALEALRYGKLTGGGQVVNFGEEFRLAEGSWDLNLPEIDEAMFLIKAGMQDQAALHIERLFTSLSSSRAITIEQAYSVSIHFISRLTQTLSELGFHQLRSKLLKGSLYNRIFGSGTIGELNLLLAGLAKEAAECVQNNRQKKANKIVDEIKAYISEAFRNPDVSLASVSRAFHLNASYCSRMFKQETGQSFTDYLLKVRIEEAVKLLNETDWKAYQIAEQVGIKDPYYFSHCFKKVMGVSVQEFKRATSTA